MALTKVNAGVTGLNQTGSESGLKMPTGTSFSGTPAEGMMRNDTSQASEGSDSTMQHYNGTTWKNYVNGPFNPFAADVYLDPATLPSSGAITEWANSGTNNHVATVYGTSGSISVDTLDTAKCAKATAGTANKGLAMNPSGTTGLNRYSLYNTQANYSYYAFMAPDSTFNTALEYPQYMQLGVSTGSSTSDYYNTITTTAWRQGVAYAEYLYIHYYDSTGTLITNNTTTETTTATNPYPEWMGIGVTQEYNPSGTSNVKLFKNGSLVYTYNYTAAFGSTSNSLGFGISYWPGYNYGGMYFGDIMWWGNTLKSESEILAVHNYFKADYGL